MTHETVYRYEVQTLNYVVLGMFRKNKIKSNELTSVQITMCTLIKKILKFN